MNHLMMGIHSETCIARQSQPLFECRCDLNHLMGPLPTYLGMLVLQCYCLLFLGCRNTEWFRQWQHSATYSSEHKYTWRGYSKNTRRQEFLSSLQPYGTTTIVKSSQLTKSLLCGVGFYFSAGDRKISSQDQQSLHHVFKSSNFTECFLKNSVCDL